MSWIEVNGAKIERSFLLENIAEAQRYEWTPADWSGNDQNDHTHCIICGIAIPSRPNPKNLSYYRAANCWLCSYCFNEFISKESQGTPMNKP